MTKLALRTALLSAAVSAMFVSGARAVTPAEPSSQDLAAEVAQLKAQVARLEAKQSAATTQPASAEQATVQQVRADAQSRSTMLAEAPLVSNYQGGKFLLQSEDGRYVLHPWLQFQGRYSTAYRSDVGGTSDTQSGFELRRMKFGFDGNVMGPDLTYLFNWATDRNTGAPILEEGWVSYHFPSSDWTVRGGQIKDPLTHEGGISSKKLLAAERTILTDVLGFGDNFVQAASVMYGTKNTPLQAEIAFNDGSNSANHDFRDFPTNNADFGAAARAQYKVTGDWGNYDDFTPLGTKKDLLVFGGGGDWTQAGGTNTYLYTLDGQFESAAGEVGDGQLAAFGAFLGRYMSSGAGHTNDWGGVAQVSYLLPDQKVEPFARYDYVWFDNAFAGTEHAMHEITVGVNRYFAGHNAKFTLDVTYLPNGAPGDGGADVLVSTSTEWLLRAQFQLLL